MVPKLVDPTSLQCFLGSQITMHNSINIFMLSLPPLNNHPAKKNRLWEVPYLKKPFRALHVGHNVNICMATQEGIAFLMCIEPYTWPDDLSPVCAEKHSFCDQKLKNTPLKLGMKVMKWNKLDRGITWSWRLYILWPVYPGICFWSLRVQRAPKSLWEVKKKSLWAVKIWSFKYSRGNKGSLTHIANSWIHSLMGSKPVCYMKSVRVALP